MAASGCAAAKRRQCTAAAPDPDDAAACAETQQRMLDTGVGVFDLEIIRIDSCFELQRYVRLLVETALGAALRWSPADDPDPSWLAG